MLCKCGCGQELPAYKQNKKFIYGHHKKFIEAHKDEMIECACGCGQLRTKHDPCGKELKFIHGHNPPDEKTRAIRAELNRQRKGIFKHRSESKQKTSRSLIKFYEENTIPQERIDRIADKLRGIPKSPEACAKMSRTAKKRLEDPTKHPRYGITLTQETKDAISLSLIEYYEEHPEAKMIGEDNPMWCGGISYEPYGPEFNEQLRRSIRKRDNYTCQICNDYGKYVHHINYVKTDNHSENLITLCSSCHGKTNYNRNLWRLYFFLKFWVSQAS